MPSCFMHSGVLHKACGARSCLTIYVNCVTCNSIVSHSSAAVRASSGVRDRKTLCWWFQQPQGDMSYHVIKHHAAWCCHVSQHKAMSSLIAPASLSSGEPCFRAVCGTIPVASPNLNNNKLSSASHVLLSAFNTLQRHLLEGLTLRFLSSTLSATVQLALALASCQLSSRSMQATHCHRLQLPLLQLVKNGKLLLAGWPAELGLVRHPQAVQPRSM